MLIYKHQI